MDPPADEMRRRFVEALRRAEIIALLNAATDPGELALDLAEELSEAFDAEIAMVVRTAPRAGDWRVLAGVGAPTADPRRLQGWAAFADAARGGPSTRDSGADLLGLGGRSSLLTGMPIDEPHSALVFAVIRLYPQEFTDAERALIEAVAVSATHALQRFWAQERNDRLVAELRETMIGTAAALANTLEARDDYTGGHARQIAELAVGVGERLGMGPDALDELRLGAIFHDIGKVAVPDEILRKTGPLDRAEWEVMKEHTIIGARILEPVPRMGAVRAMVRSSHERWDGGGYPDGLAGGEIPVGARIIAVVDAWHAMVTTRPYRDALKADAATQQLRAEAGSQFDPAIVEAFLGWLSEER